MNDSSYKMNMTGISDSFAEGPPTSAIVIFTSLYAILTIGTIFGNLLVITTFWKFSNLRTASNNILVSLSVADMLMAVVFVLHITNILGPNTVSPTKLCGTTSILNLTFNSVIILHLSLISVERFIAVKFSLRYQTLVTKRRALIASIVVWLYGIGVSVVLPEPLRADGLGALSEFLRALTPCFDLFQNEPFVLVSNSAKAYLIFLVLTLLAAPIALIVISYSYIFTVAWKQRKQITQEERNLQVVTLSMKREMKAARTVAIVVGLCLASFVPLLVVLCLRFLTSTMVGPHHVLSTYLTASLNALWNPLIYCWRNESFRRSFKRLLRCNPW